MGSRVQVPPSFCRRAACVRYRTTGNDQLSDSVFRASVLLAPGRVVSHGSSNDGHRNLCGQERIDPFGERILFQYDKIGCFTPNQLAGHIFPPARVGSVASCVSQRVREGECVLRQVGCQ